MPLEVAQDDIAIEGHAIEARLYAEDATNDFLPSTGRIVLWEPVELPGLRYDGGIETGSEVSVHYDPLMAKIIAHGSSRDEALGRLVRALRKLGVGGVVTNRDFLLAVLTHAAFEEGELDTHFIEKHLPEEAREVGLDEQTLLAHAVVAALYDYQRRNSNGGPLPASIPSGWRNNRWRPQDVFFETGGRTIEVDYVVDGEGAFAVGVGEAATDEGNYAARTADSLPRRALTSCFDATGIVVELDGVRRRFRVAEDGERIFVHGPAGTSELTRVARFPAALGEELAGGCVAPMTGVIRQVNVAVGDEVEEGAVLLMLEAMKMEHQLVAHAPGVVQEVRVEVGQMVDPDDVLVVVEPLAKED